MNIVIMCGRATKDAEVKYNGDKAVARFTLAVDKRFKKEGEDTADFFDVVCFGKTAEFVEKYVKKGQKYLIDGSLSTGSYTNKEGKKVYTTDVIADHIEFASSKTNSGVAPAPTTDADGFMNIPDGIDEELPFN